MTEVNIYREGGALALTGAFNHSDSQRMPPDWANRPKPDNLFAELEAACERISKLRTPVIMVPDEETKAQVQSAVKEHGLDAEVLTQQEYWEQEAIRHRCAQFPPIPFELTHDPLPHAPRNRRERRHGRDY